MADLLLAQPFSETSVMLLFFSETTPAATGVVIVGHFTIGLDVDE